MKSIINIYATLISRGAKKIDEVPEHLRADVEAALKEIK